MDVNSVGCRCFMLGGRLRLIFGYDDDRLSELMEIMTAALTRLSDVISVCRLQVEGAVRIAYRLVPGRLRPRAEDIGRLQRSKRF